MHVTDMDWAGRVLARNTYSNCHVKLLCQRSGSDAFITARTNVNASTAPFRSCGQLIRHCLIAVANIQPPSGVKLEPDGNSDVFE